MNELHSRDFDEGTSRPDEIFRLTHREPQETKFNEYIPDQKVLLVFDQITTFKTLAERDGAEKHYEELLTFFDEHYDCEILPGTKPCLLYTSPSPRD